MKKIFLFFSCVAALNFVACSTNSSHDDSQRTTDSTQAADSMANAAQQMMDEQAAKDTSSLDTTGIIKDTVH